MASVEYINKALDIVRPEHGAIAGQHNKLEEWKALYSGECSNYNIDVIERGVSTKRKILTSGIAKTGCEKWASIYLNEGLDITVPNDNEQAIINDILERNHFKDKLNKFGEKMFALGKGLILAMPSGITYNENGELISADDIKIYFNDATRIIPITYDDGELIEVGVIRYATNKIYIQLHLINENGMYDVYEFTGDKDENGYTLRDEYTTWNTTSTTPIFQEWYPNVVDNTYLDNNNGVSVLDGCSDLIFTFETMFDKMYTEFKNGAKKRYISSDLQYIDANGNKSQVPLGDEDVYLPPSQMGNAANMTYEHQSELRVQSFISGMDFVARLLSKKMGLGDAAFNLDANGGRPLQTATAEMLKQQDAMQNVMKNESLATDRIKQLLMSIKYVYNTLIQENALTYEYTDIKVTYEDNIIEDTTEKKKNELEEVKNGVLAEWEFRSHWYGEDEETAKQYLQDNGLLINKYMTALQGGGLTPEQYVELVFGAGKQEIANALKEAQPTDEIGDDE